MTDTREPSPDLFEGPPRRRNPIVRVALIVLGAVLVIAGVALGPVPVVPGFPLVIAGVLLLAASSGVARRGINRAERWLPERTRRLVRKALHREAKESASADPCLNPQADSNDAARTNTLVHPPKEEER